MCRSLVLLLALALAGCGGEAPAPAPGSAASAVSELAHAEPAGVDPVAAPAERRAPAARPGAPVRARFLDARTDAPLEGSLVRVLAGDEEIEWCVTDAAGVTVAVEDAPFGPVRLVLERPSLLVDLVFDVEHEPGVEPVIFALVGADLASPVRARLTDVRTGAPLAGAAVAVRYGAHAVLDVTTDAEGRLATRTAVPHGPIELVVDRGPLLAEATLAAAHGPLADLAFAVDPGDRLELAVEPPHVALVVDLAFEDAAGEVASELAGHRLGAPLRLDLVPVRAVRVRTGDRLWAGRAELAPSEAALRDSRSAIAGLEEPVAPSAVTVTLEPRGTVRARVRDAAGATPAEAWIALSRGERYLYGRLDAASGVATFEGLEPGSWLVEAGAARTMRVEREVSVRALEWTELELELDPLPVAGAVTGELVSASGAAVPSTAVTLELPGGWLIARPRWVERDGRRVAPFCFDGVPAGEHRLTVRGPDQHDWTPDALVVRAPASGLELTCDDAAGTVWLALDVLAAETGEPPPYWRVELGDGRGMRRSERYQWSVHMAWTARADLVWIVTAPGRRPVAGGLAELVPWEVPTEGGTTEVLVGTVRLERTDERTLFVRDDAGRPLAGAVVTLDGLRVGATDALGRVTVASRLASSARGGSAPQTSALEGSGPQDTALEGPGLRAPGLTGGARLGAGSTPGDLSVGTSSAPVASDVLERWPPRSWSVELPGWRADWASWEAEDETAARAHYVGMIRQ